MKRLIAPLFAVAALALIPVSAPAATSNCPPGTTNPDYCVKQVSPVAKSNATAVAHALKKKKTVRALARTSHLHVTLKAAGPGTVRINVDLLNGQKKPLRCITYVKRATRAGTFSATLTLSTKCRAALRKIKHSVRLQITSTFTSTGGVSSTQVLFVTLRR